MPTSASESKGSSNMPLSSSKYIDSLVFLVTAIIIAILQGCDSTGRDYPWFQSGSFMITGATLFALWVSFLIYFVNNADHTYWDELLF